MAKIVAKEGDRVCCLKPYDDNNNIVNNYGTIIKIKNNIGFERGEVALVEFDNNVINSFPVVSSRANKRTVMASRNLWWIPNTKEYLKKINDKNEVKKKPHTIVVFQDGNKVIALDKDLGVKAEAKCHSKDKFNFHHGAKIAVERLEKAVINKN